MADAPEYLYELWNSDGLGTWKILRHPIEKKTACRIFFTYPGGRRAAVSRQRLEAAGVIHHGTARRRLHLTPPDIPGPGTASESAPTREDQIAELLRAGATYRDVERQLGAAWAEARQVRVDRAIPFPPGRAKRFRAELDAADQAAARMLLAGASVEDIYTETRCSLTRIAALRRELGSRVPARPRPRRAVDEVLALYTRATADGGHQQWTGPRRGRTKVLIQGRTQRFNVRHLTFERAHGRPPTGRVRSTCGLTDCITGTHLADAVIRGTAPATATATATATERTSS
ncbi:hypothetical protein AB0M23_28530 [Streptomyces sp. NPDC052077]|uniref:hypothetical protein n=1 Tax=Streptomyces sp. NPDC052077 TaxID=3154757 RepID=UPI00343CB7D4